MEDRITPTVYLAPSDLRDIYGVNNIPAFHPFGSSASVTADGTGQTIAIVIPFNDPSIISDLNTFDGTWGASSSSPTLYQDYGPATTPNTSPGAAGPGAFFNVLNQQGQNITNYVTQVTGTTGQTFNGVFVPGVVDNLRISAEAALDVEMAHSIAPGAKIDLVEVNSAGDQTPDSDQFAGFAVAASLGSVVSMSTAYSEFQTEPVNDHVFEHPGVTFIASAGDTGANGGYPAYSPNVLAVGGTQFNVSGNTVTSEVVWNNSQGSTGGGISAFEQEPAYQEAVQSTGFRTSPDVASDAGTPVDFYDSYNGPTNDFNAPFRSDTGDSVGAPCWAGLIAITNQGLALNGVGPLNSSDPQETMRNLYQLGAPLNNPYFNDITQGNNDFKPPPVPFFTASQGYDEVTGLGTPNADQLIPTLVALHPHYEVTTNLEFPNNGPSGQSPVSLSSALQQANAAADSGLSPTITFASSLDGATIQLVPNQIAFVIAGRTGTTTTIDASSLPHGITIDANFQSHVFSTFSDAVLDGLTITHGQGMESDMFFDSGSGGGIEARADLTVENCTIIDNREMAPDPSDPNNFDTVGGGGISISSGNLTVINSTIADNHAAGEGGGIFQSNSDIDGVVTVVNSTIAGNMTDGSGGGLCADLATVSDSTIVKNHAQFGGGIISPDFSPVLQNTIVANNTASSSAPDIFYRLAPLEASYCLIGDTSGINSFASDAIGNITNPTYLGLSNSLANYGGRTPTIALLPAIGNLPPSPAIGNGSVSRALDAYGDPLTTDQRGQPRFFNGSVDIGAYQTQGTSANPVVTSSSDTGGGMTLQDAVNLAEAEAAAAAPAPVTITITIAPNVSTITLTAPISVSGVSSATINIVGNLTRISGGNTSKLFSIDTTTTVSLSTIQMESAEPVTGAISNAGTLLLSDCTFQDNVATGYGGAIYNTGTVFLSGCHFDANLAGVSGGAVYNTGTMTAIDCHFTGNTGSGSGGAIANVGGMMTLLDCSLSGNVANAGGALWNSGVLSIGDCTLDHNLALGTTGANGLGGAIFNAQGGSVELSDNTQVTMNVAEGGAGSSGESPQFDPTGGPGGGAGDGGQGLGGGIYNNGGQVTITGGSLLGNSAIGGQGGAGPAGAPGRRVVFFFGNNLLILGSNGGAGGQGGNGGAAFGGAVYTNGGLVTITGATLFNNQLTNEAVGGQGGNGGAGGNGASFTVIGNGGDGFASGPGNLISTGPSGLDGGNGGAGGSGGAAGGGAIYNAGGTLLIQTSEVRGQAVGGAGGKGGGGGGITLGLGGSAGFGGAGGNGAAGLGGGLGSNGGLAVVLADTFAQCAASGGAGSNGGASGFALFSVAAPGGSSAAGQGGAVGESGGTIVAADCTFNGNMAASGSGGAIANDSTTLTLTNCTVSGNSAAAGGGLFNQGTLFIANSIVAQNTAPTGGPDAAGTIISEGHNLVGATDGSSGWAVSDLTGTSAAPLNPLLAALGNYGGPTRTMALLPGSQAIDAGDNTLIPSGVGTDQRGLSRVVNGTVDIGAFESRGFTIAVTSGNGQSTDILHAFAAPLVVTVTARNSSEPVAGGLILFTLPAPGASATVNPNAATISSTCTATVVATANGVAGNYAVSATARGITIPASFSLSNRPTVTVPGAQTAYQNVDLAISGIVIGNDSSSAVTVTLQVSNGTLTLGTTNSPAMITGSGTGSVTLSGTTANVNAALATLVYRGSHNFSGGDTLSVTAIAGGASATPASVAITVESIAQEATNLQAQVSALQTAGLLNQGHANSLIAKLNLQGNNGDVGKVQAFLNEVQADLNAGLLTQAEASTLQILGNILLLSVTRR
jgi:predicted outer membrane repeat protein